MLGAFQKESVSWNVERVPDDFSFQLLDPDWEKYAQPLRAGRHRIPVLEKCKFPKFVNGPESFTPDNNFLMGEPAGTKGLFVLAGFNSVGIASAGGAGKYAAEWLENGSPTLDLWSVDVRFRLRATPPVLGDSPAGKSKKLVIIDYDDLAAQEHGLGRWPWNRRVHAGLIDRLREAGAGGVVVDLLFTYPTKDPGEDQALVQAVQEARVFLPVVFTIVPGEKNTPLGDD